MERRSQDDWFEEAFPGAKKEFPEPLNPEICKTYIIEFIEDKPRNVPIVKGRIAPVIEINCAGKSRSLFLSRKYLAQKILELQENYGSLMGLKIKLHLKTKTKKYYEYDIEIIEE